MRRVSPNVFELLRTTLIKVKGTEDVHEDDAAFDELKESIVRTATELSVLKDPHHDEESSS